jgi:lipoate-protein ligase A
MALDEALLQVATKEYIQPVLRLYTFTKPSVTAGYFQRLSESDYPDREKVRRITGGGIVLHGCDLTIALIISSEDADRANKGDSSRRDSIYRLFSGALVFALKDCSPQIDIMRQGAVEEKRRYECFQRPVTGDLVVEGKKLAGCALRRRRGVSLLHGSLRVYNGEQDGASSLEELLGKKPDLGRKPDISVVKDRVAWGFSEVLECAITESALSSQEMKIASQLEKKYSDLEWNFRK